ncbi:hypothetical protein MJO52_15475 [Microbulbifer variabilis]|uniref:DUF4178 domain-containing protein n=1 Tax=Microbulbifer variabilis TaxID=266805 RepID=A0ABY4V963_9GAMM|nr:hypothetical protein [Microbulbifer variabilis]USD20465.1 hypothetical protein MJO52_15475 [Microbulbifer variabilis]
MNIEPGVGIGEIKYGIFEKDLIRILGNPDRIEKGEYVEGSGDWHRVLWYSHKNLSFTFDKEDDYRLGVITVMGSGYPLFGKDLFNLPKNTVRDFITKVTNEIPKFEDHSFDSDPHECLDHNSLGIIFWFDSGDLSEMQCSYLFETDNETVKWP